MKILITENQYKEQLLDLLNNGQFELAIILMENLGINIYSFLNDILKNTLNKNYTISSSDVGNFNANELFTFNVTYFTITPNLENDFIYDNSNKKIKSLGTIKFYVNIDGSFSDWNGNSYNINDYINIDEDNKSEILYYIKNALKDEFKFIQYFNLNIIYSR